MRHYIKKEGGCNMILDDTGIGIEFESENVYRYVMLDIIFTQKNIMLFNSISSNFKNSTIQRIADALVRDIKDIKRKYEKELIDTENFEEDILDTTSCLYSIFDEVVISDPLSRKFQRWKHYYISLYLQKHKFNSYEVSIKENTNRKLSYLLTSKEDRLDIAADIEDIAEEFEAWIDTYEIAYSDSIKKISYKLNSIIGLLRPNEGFY